MKSYKNKQTGEVVVCYPSYEICHSSTEDFSIPKRFVENSRDWEQVIEKDYEILEVKIADGTIITYENGICTKRTDKCSVDQTLSLEQILRTNHIKYIHSVKRLSDGEIFTVGDCFDVGLGSRVLESIWLDNDGVLGLNHEKGRITNTKGTGVFSKAKKISPTLFVTEDGVSITKDSKSYCHVDLRTYAISESNNPIPGISGNMIGKGFVYFSTKEAAQKYIDSKKVLIRTQDGVDLFEGDRIFFLSKDMSISDSFLINRYIKFNQDGNYYFSSQSKLEYFECMNKKILSLHDLNQILEMCGNPSSIKMEAFKIAKNSTK